MHVQPSSWNIVLCTLSWIFWSNLTILFNKWILESTPFRYPILLTTWHLTIATLATQFLAHATPLLDARKSIQMTPTLYIQRIAPIGLLYSASLVCSNVAYLYLNISFIQMLKASGPVITLLTSYTWGVTDLTLRKLLNISVIALSVALTVSGEEDPRFSWFGVAIQLSALLFDANRLVMIQTLLSPSSYQPSQGVGNKDDTSEDPKMETEMETEMEKEKETKKKGNLKMDPLTSLYYTAPICALFNGILAWRAELSNSVPVSGLDTGFDTNFFGGLPWGDILETGIGILFLNAVVGFALNVAVFTLIGKTSSLTMTLVSIPKNILLIAVSVGIWGVRVSGVQVVGYVGALGGLVVYSGGGVYFRYLFGHVFKRYFRYFRRHVGSLNLNLGGFGSGFGSGSGKKLAGEDGDGKEGLV